MTLQQHLESLPSLLNERKKDFLFQVGDKWNIDLTALNEFLLQSNKDCVKAVIEEIKGFIDTYPEGSEPNDTLETIISDLTSAIKE